MKETVRTSLRYLTATAALLGMALLVAACGGDGGAADPGLEAAIAAAESAAPPGKRPIVETHIHFWQATRPGGVPWPTPAEGPIFRDVLPPEYTAFAKSQGVGSPGTELEFAL